MAYGNYGIGAGAGGYGYAPYGGVEAKPIEEPKARPSLREQLEQILMGQAAEGVMADTGSPLGSIEAALKGGAQ